MRQLAWRDVQGCLSLASVAALFARMLALRHMLMEREKQALNRAARDHDEMLDRPDP
jgi:hypothetical protein